MEFLTPLALEQLETDPFAEGHLFPGDLLVSVMRLPAGYWRRHPAHAARMRAIANRVVQEFAGRGEIADIEAEIGRLLSRASWRATSHE
jgi:hypothetical protein